MSDCVLCDWECDPYDEPWAVYLPDTPTTGAVTWGDAGPRTVYPWENIADTWCGVATMAHWARAHPEQLLGALGVDLFEIRHL